jgi:hypothetical protein
MSALSPYVEERTRYFTGRQWVFSAIGGWLGSDTAARVFLLTGGPGTGKTAVAARVAQMSLREAEPAHPVLGKDGLSYFHFCQAGAEHTLSPVTFVQSLSQALANRYPAFRAGLEKAGSRQIVINTVQTVGTLEAGSQVIGAQIGQINIEIKGTDARPLFDEAVRRPLQELAATVAAGERIVILIDSLDEALTFNAENNIVQLLGLADDFPPQVRFLLTCRSSSDRVFDLVGPSTLDLIADAPPSLDEVTPYVMARLQSVPEPGRSVAAARISAKSEGNFLYAHHVVNDLLSQSNGHGIADADTLDLPDALEGVYRKFLERELASNRTRWNDVYRPIVGSIAVARGDGLTKAQLLGITDLAEDTATDVLGVCAQYLVGGDGEGTRYRIYHQSFREFLLADEKFTVVPSERHAAIARYLQDRYGANWGRCDDEYALRYTPAHWADAATLSPVKRETRTHALIDLAANRKYQHRFEGRIGDLPMLHAHLNRAVQVAALNDRDDMLPSIVKAGKEFIAFRREYLRSESLVALAEAGRLKVAEARLPLFMDVDEDWQAAARLILAWLGAERNAVAATELRDSVARSLPDLAPIPLLLARVNVALIGQPLFPAVEDRVLPLEVGQQLVKRIGGQAFDRELLGTLDERFISTLGLQAEMVGQRGFSASFDAPILVNMARTYGPEGTTLVDEYIDAHAGYNYIEYRNRSLWHVLHAVLLNHGDQQWVRNRLRRVLIAALSGGGVDFEEMLPLTAASLLEQVRWGDAQRTLDKYRTQALRAADALQQRRGADDSWGNHRRRLTALMELSHLLLRDASQARMLLDRILALPGGFAGFQAPARLRLADAIRVCRIDAGDVLDQTLEDALKSAHHIQDYHFCARITARCNALRRWHGSVLVGADLAATITRLARSPNDVEFAADHVVHEPYMHRHDEKDLLPVTKARDAAALQDLVEVFQRSAVEFRRLNPQYGINDVLPDATPIHVPDPGLAPLLAVNLAARALADDSIAEERVALVRSLVPVAAANPTALDTVLSYLAIAADLQDAELVEEIVAQVGSVVFADVPAPEAQIGPDAVMPA